MNVFYSCSVWGNFSTYFNRYYNAKNEFEKAEAIIEQDQKKELFAFKEEKLPSKAIKNLDKVVEGCSKILQFNKETSYVDESLFMLGRSFYYKGQFNKALRKFRELDARGNEDLDLENKLWISKSELQMRNFVTGLEQLEEVKTRAIEEDDDEILFESYRTHISYLIYRENYNLAIELINDLLQLSLPGDVAAEVIYELGKLYVVTKNYEKAAEAFYNVDDESPTFEVYFNSQLEYAKTLNYLDRSDESLEILEDLRDDDKYEIYWDKIELEIAQIHYDRGDSQLALDLFTEVDTTYKKTESSGIAAFMRADIVENDFRDFDSAKVLYDRVNATSAPIDFKNEAKSISELLKRRKEFADKIKMSKQNYFYIEDSIRYVEDSTAYAGWVTRRDSAEAIYKETMRIVAESPQSVSKRSRDKVENLKFKFEEEPPFPFKPKKPNITTDSMKTFIARNEYEIGNLYFIDLEISDSAYANYTDILTNYPNTRYQARTLYSLGTYYLTLDDKIKADSLFQDVYDNHKDEPIAVAAAEKLGLDIGSLDVDPAKAKYLIAEENIDAKRFEEAIANLKEIPDNYPESSYAPKSLYTIGWIYENELFISESAAEAYDTLSSRYPNTDYAKSILPQLTFYNTAQQVIQDSLDHERAILDSLASIAVSDSLISTDSLTAYSTQDSLITSDSLITQPDSLNENIITEPDTVNTNLIEQPPETDSETNKDQNSDNSDSLKNKN